MLKFKDTVFPMAFQPGSDGVRLLAVKFVEAIVLLYTPDPNGSSQPPLHQDYDGKVVGFNISWLHGGHPVLNVGHLATEASHSLGLLLDQLRFPMVKSLSNSIIIALINSLSAIAKNRPAFYGRILPVLIGFDPSSSVIKGMSVSGAHYVLKNAFLGCLKCTHQGAAPWRGRLVDALKSMNSGTLAEHAIGLVDKISMGIDHSTGESHPTKEEKLLEQACDGIQIDMGRKRCAAQDVNLVQDDDTPGKRARPTLNETKESVNTNSSLIQDNQPLIELSGSTGDADTGPVGQLVALFGALVAQGDKAVGSLDILISSISSDLLAEVVMANMRYLPHTRPIVEEEEKLISMGSSSIMPPTSLESGFLSLSSAFPQIASLLALQPSVSHDTRDVHLEDTQQKVTMTDTADISDTTAPVASTGIAFPEISLVLPGMEKVRSPLPSDTDVDILENEIPGLDSTVRIVQMQDTLDASHSATGNMEGTSQEQVPTSNSPFSTQCLLPKMSVPIVSLTDEEKDHLQKLAFEHIIEAYKQVAVAGGSHIHVSVLACLGVEYPLELDAWGLLQKHILSDYLNHEGHELTLRVLYMLFREAEKDQDFFSSTTATSIYESFLLTVAETLRDSFPASDKSLSRLLGEVPYLPKGAFKLLESLCSPISNEKNEKESLKGDRVTQGLSAIWSLILLRPPIRDACLKIALQSAVHHLEEVRMKAIRLVANKLYPMPCLAKKIEEFANEMLLSVVNTCQDMEGIDGEESTTVVSKDTYLERISSGGQASVSAITKEVSSDTTQLSSAQSVLSTSIEAQRCMSLYFALCTKKHSLLRHIFTIYKGIPKAAKQAVHRHIPILVRTIGSSSELLGIISDPPTGSESLLMQVLHTLTDGTVPSPELIFTVRMLYDSKLKDVEILIPILSSLPKDEVLRIFPKLVNLPLDKFQAAIARMLQGSSQSGPALTPAEVLIAIHGIDPEKDGIPLKKVTDACSSCFEQRQVFTQQVLAKVLNQLVEQIPLPLLFMRTVIQAIGAFPALVDFIMEILSRLVSKQIWKYPKLWVGFLKCTLQTKPQSFNVLLQLPAAQLENALNRNPTLKPPLIDHANQPNIRSSLPRSTLVVLGLVQESHTGSQAQASQTQTVEESNSGADAPTERTQESEVVG
ncbi:HEAT repeat-containing protein isoform X2 [Tasmannia lanceolata]